MKVIAAIAQLARKPLKKLVLSSLLTFIAALSPAQFLSGDIISMSSSSQARLNSELRVGPNGLAEVPMLGKVRVAGISKDALRSTLMERYSRLGINASDLEIERSGSARRTIAFSGAVKEPGSMPFRRGLRLSDIVLVAMPTPSADLEAISITNASGKSTTHKFVSLAIAANADWNVPLYPGDSVFFTPLSTAPEVVVLGEVNHPGPVDFVPGMTLKQVIGLVGGLTGNAKSSAIEIERGGKVVDTVNLDFGYETVLKRGDIIRVPRLENPEFIFVSGAVVKPGRFAFRVGMRLAEALAAAEGFLETADQTQIFITRRVNGTPKKTRHNYERILRLLDPNPSLEPGDLVEISFKRRSGAK